MSIRSRASPVLPNQPVEKLLPPRPSQNRSFPIVGIGASAGGLEAFTLLLRALPVDTGMAFVLIQHLAPDHKSMLADILSRQTKMPISEVQDRTRVEPNHVYVIPPKAQMSIQGGVLTLGPRQGAAGSFMPIDYFFRSLAADKGNDAIAVILSGGDGDGSQALKAIKSEGGITFAQDPKSAKIDSMPLHAAATGLVDFVLAPEQIAQELTRIAHDPAAIQLRKALGDESLPTWTEDLSTLYALLLRARGVDFTHYKQATLRRRIARRMMIQKAATLKDYTKALRTNPAEVTALFDDILIHVTEFFRDGRTFDDLKTLVFPRLMNERAPNDPIRIWVPGCATGEEAYSIIICLLEFLGDQAERPGIQVFATDVSEKPLHKARAGIYSEQALSHVSAERRQRYFTQVAGGYQILKSIRDLCVFAKQNVAKDPPFSKLDMISCRNVLIYLDPVLQKRVMPIFHYALKPSGLLLLGNSETLGLYSDLFNPLNKKVRVYSKIPILPRQHPIFQASEYPREKASPEALKNPPEVDNLNMLKEADQYVMDKHGPAGVIVDEAINIVQFRGPLSRYLELSAGMANHNLFKLAKDGLLLELRLAMQRARKEKNSVRIDGSRIKIDGQYRAVTVEVIPLKQAPSAGLYFLVLFELTPSNLVSKDSSRKAGRRPLGHAALRAAEAEIARLKKEQEAAKEYLKSIISHQEALNEELKAANEEALSSNEELQSANEELETAKEELQATNEETITLNEELHNRNAELSQLNGDLVNVMRSSSDPIVVLGSDHHIRRLTPAAERMLAILPADIGRSIHEIKLPVSVPDLEALVASVLRTLVPYEREVEDAAGRWYNMRVQLYKTLEDKIDGVVLSFSDIQIAKERQATALAWATELEARVKARTEELMRTQSALHQAEKLEAIGRLAGGVAHDFNNLMTGILGITEDVQQQLGATSPHREDLDAVIAAARKATALTKQLLAFGRRQVSAPEALNLNQVITSMDALFKRLLGEDVQVRTLLDPKIGNVKLDQGQLEQLIVNLGLNARDAMMTGGTLTLETRNAELPQDGGKRLFEAPPGLYVTLSITDTGSGMSQETTDHIFEPFFTTKGEGKGTGLGLANVYGIVKQSGGDIVVDSQPGRGTTFRLYFPHAGDARDEERRSLDRRDAPGGSETILVVEDEDIVRKTTAKALRKKGYTVLHAHDAQAALVLLDRHCDPIDLLLTDVIMPGMNGHDLGRLAAAKRPNMKILYMSGYSQDVLGQRGVPNDRVHFIEKTFTSEGLCRKVRNVLDAAKEPAAE